jgi:LEA14-like dessication related protein
MRNLYQFVLLLFITFGLSSCGIYQPVQFKGVEDVSVQQFSQTAIVVEVQAIIDNPNGYNITIYDSDLDFMVNGTKFGKAKIDRTITLKKKAKDTYTFVVKADMQGLSGKMGVLFPILLTGKATVKVKGNVLAKALGLKKKAPIEFVEELSF